MIIDRGRRNMIIKCINYQWEVEVGAEDNTIVVVVAEVVVEEVEEAQVPWTIEIGIHNDNDNNSLK